jgi:hypothetical protein
VPKRAGLARSERDAKMAIYELSGRDRAPVDALALEGAGR